MTNAVIKPRQLSPEAAAFRKVLGRFAAGIALIDASGGADRATMAVNSFAPVSLEPPLVLFCAWRNSESWAGIRSAGAFSASLLTSDQIEVSSAFARKLPDRYEKAAWTPLPSGRQRLAECVGWMDCEIFDVTEAGDHDVCIGRVVDHGLGEEGHEPVVFYSGKYWRDMKRVERLGATNA